MSKASKYGKKVPSYSQPDPWHPGENGSFFFFSKGGSNSKRSLVPGVCLCMSRERFLSTDTGLFIPTQPEPSILGVPTWAGKGFCG